MLPGRLSVDDVSNLAMEAPDTLMHQAAFGAIDGRRLLGADGLVRIEPIRKLLAVRATRTPELRRVLHSTGLLQGRPLWVDDPGFRIERHVHAATLPSPGGEPALLRFVERTLAEPMDRSMPLWQMWFLDGFEPDRIGIVLKAHHAMVDGPAMVNLVAQLFALEPDDAAPTDGAKWTPVPAPSRRRLVSDSLGRASGDLVSAAFHPLRLARRMKEQAVGGWQAMRRGRGAPVTSLNRPIGIARRIAVSRFGLADFRRVAHANGVKLNDVFLDVIAAGLRSVLASRGEPTDIALHASVAVSLHPAGDASRLGNKVGTMVLPIPLGEDDARARLSDIAAISARAKAEQRAFVTPSFMAALTRSGLTRSYLRRQRMINVLTTNLHGPEFPLYVAGARVLEVFPAPPIAGNVTVSFAAMSYDGQFNVCAVCDAASWPDLDVLVAGMRKEWEQLKRGSPSVPLAAGL